MVGLSSERLKLTRRVYINKLPFITCVGGTADLEICQLMCICAKRLDTLACARIDYVPACFLAPEHIREIYYNGRIYKVSRIQFITVIPNSIFEGIHWIFIFVLHYM
jgi:hypothetical protein